MKKITKLLSFMLATIITFSAVAPQTVQASLLEKYEEDEIVEVTNSNSIESAYKLDTNDCLLYNFTISKDNPVYVYVEQGCWEYNIIRMTFENDKKLPLHVSVIEEGEVIHESDYDENNDWLEASSDYPDSAGNWYLKVETDSVEDVQLYIELWNYSDMFAPKPNWLDLEPANDGIVYIRNNDYEIWIDYTRVDYTIKLNGKIVTVDEYYDAFDKPGKYRIEMENIYGKNECTVVYDNAAPVVKGVKNNKTYKKPVTIKFSDNISGIKSAKLNGKTIKSGKKITKLGKYTLKVTDKCGNTKTIKFKIKKK